MDRPAVPARESQRRGLAVLDVVLVVLVPALAVLTVAVMLRSTVDAAVVSSRLDLVIGTLATLIAVSVALMAWGRYRESGELAGLFRGSAFFVLAALNAVTILVGLLDIERAFGLSLAEPGQLPLLGNAVARALCAVLLILGGIAAVRGDARLRLPSLLVLAGPALLLIAMLVVAATVQPSLPAVIGPDEATLLRNQPAQPLLMGTGLTVLAFVQVLIGIGFGSAAALSYVAYRRESHSQEAYLAVGLVLAAFSQLHAAVHPGVYASLVTSGDLLRVAFYAVLLLGVVAERRADLRALRRAHLDLQRLRDAELAEATYEERARLAREIHDGLAQDLWYAKLKQARLATLEPMPADARELAQEVVDAIDSSLAEARQAVMALRPTESGPFAQVLARYVEDFGDRFGIRVDCSVARDVQVGSPRAQAELLRIVQEALNNVRKHADATVVRVDADRDGDGLRVRVSDNGRGFDPAAAQRSGYGLRSMAERAEGVGATLRVEARPQDGTRVEVLLPAKAGAA